MSKNTQIEAYITTDKSPLNTGELSKRFVTIRNGFDSVNNIDMKLTDITPTDAYQYKQPFTDKVRSATSSARLL
ncbi:hypothetical protein [Legionella sainthelensi]|uniref:Uncharacterized protein n=1 Tax=Legionella sainthelensi TaxID=28087 RepID=A0A2H5FJU4_9GAMM|nr:hypothetical protein [Legionella sainthelensi]AUH71821.1 hypothetical protein CAB17_06880 [Legionella sainthelensi]